MRQLFLSRKALTIHAIAQPLLEDNLILVQVHYSCISPGTERATVNNAQQSLLTNIPEKVHKILKALAEHGVSGTSALIQHKLYGDVHPLGYSCSGKVLAIGKNIHSVRVGDYVACAGAEYAHHAEYIVVPEHLVAKITESFLKPASMTTIGAIALQGIRQAHLQLGETVAVVGLGLLGQFTVQLAARAGCRVIAIDLNQERCELAQQHGAYLTINPRDESVEQKVSFATTLNGVDCTIITAASTSNTLLHQALHTTRKKGKIIIVGDVGLQLEREPWYQKEIDIHISCSYGPGRYDPLYERDGCEYPYAYVRWTEQRNLQTIADMIVRKELNSEALITHTFSLDQAGSAYTTLQQGKVLGVVLDYAPENHSTTFIPAQPIGQKIPSESLRVAFIGAGGFAKIKLLPTINAIQGARITAIVDPQSATALATAQTYGAAHALRDHTELLEQDICDVVVIASPHQSHAQQTLDALAHNKAVFVEKPLVTRHEDYVVLADFLRTHPTSRLCVDFNRTYAPFIQRIKQAIAQRTTPLMIQYRMNAGFIPYTHWTQTTIGGGRLIGEACHIIDLFGYVTDAQPRSLAVETITNHGIKADDNFVLHIAYGDGSLCSLLYTAMGHTQLGKERMEIFFDGKSIILDDYTSLTGYGLSADFTIKRQQQDKGHQALLQAFFTQLKQPTFVHPIPLERIITTTQLTLLAHDLMHAGGGTQEISAS